MPSRPFMGPDELATLTVPGPSRGLGLPPFTKVAEEVLGCVGHGFEETDAEEVARGSRCFSPSEMPSCGLCYIRRMVVVMQSYPLYLPSQPSASVGVR